MQDTEAAHLLPLQSIFCWFGRSPAMAMARGSRPAHAPMDYSASVARSAFGQIEEGSALAQEVAEAGLTEAEVCECLYRCRVERWRVA